MIEEHLTFATSMRQNSISEKQEKELLDAIYDSTLTVVKGIKK